jgi:hypothetical protein
MMIIEDNYSIDNVQDVNGDDDCEDGKLIQ